MYLNPFRSADGRFPAPPECRAGKIRLLVGWMLLVAGIHSSAQNAAAGESHSPQYVLLRNDHVLRGIVSAEGSLLTVKRDADAQLTLRSDQVLAIRDDLASLYAVRQSMKRRGTRANIADRLEDARWCVDHNLPGQATALLMEVYRMSPDHPVALQLEKRLRRSLEKTEPPTQVSQTSFTTSGPVREVEKRVSEGSHLPLVTTASAPQDLHWFTSRVQPILISRCGQCHHAGARHAGASTDWKLVLPLSGTRVSQKGTMANLRATMDYCQPGDAENSELLRQAIVFHGSDSVTDRLRTHPPIAEHERRLVETLTRWINQMDSIGAADENLAIDQAIQGTEVASPLAKVEPSRVVADLAPPPVRESSRPAAISPELRQPTRLPPVESPNDVRHYNREIEVHRRFGF